MPRSLPRCIFAEGTPYQCRRPGIGHPPLCRQHYATAETVEETQHESNAFLSAALNVILSHPKVASILDDATDLLKQTTAPQSHHVEWPPPPPHNGAAPPRSEPTPEDPRVVLGFSPGASLTRESIKARQRALAALYHPDCGGSDEAMKRLNLATEQLLAQLP